MPPPSSMYIGDILFPERPQPSSKMKNKNNGRNGVAIYRTMLKESMCQHYESFEKIRSYKIPVSYTHLTLPTIA